MPRSDESLPVDDAAPEPAPIEPADEEPIEPGDELLIEPADDELEPLPLPS